MTKNHPYAGLTPAAEAKLKWVDKDVYPYKDENGKELYQVHRREAIDDDGEKRKKFLVCHYNGDGKPVWDKSGIREIPYRLQGLVARDNKPVAIAEGERDADTLSLLGFAATCNRGGWGNRNLWQTTLWKFYEGLKEVVIFGDNDEPGREWVDTVARALTEKAGVERVKAVYFDESNRKPGYDVSDYCTEARAAGKKDTAIYDELVARANNAANWEEPDPYADQIIDSFAARTPDPPVVEYVEGMLEESSLYLWVGPPGSFKTLAAVDCAVCIARGIPWLTPPDGQPDRSMKTKQAPVLVIDQDQGPRRSKQRLAACLRGHGIPEEDGVPISIMTMVRPRVDASKIQFFNDVKKTIERLGIKVVFVDGLDTTNGGVDENDASKMNIVMNHWRQDFVERYGVTCVIIYYTNKNGGVYRGSTAIPARVDGEFVFNRTPGEPTVKITAGKTRDDGLEPVGINFSYEHIVRNNVETRELNSYRFFGVEPPAVSNPQGGRPSGPRGSSNKPPMSASGVDTAIRDVVTNTNRPSFKRLQQEVWTICNISNSTSREFVAERIELLIKQKVIVEHQGKRKGTTEYTMSVGPTF